MKVIGIKGNTATSTEPLGIYLMADSSLLLSNKPFFVPDFAPSFVMHAAIAVRIDRLGKNIATRFAHRYYQQVAACALVEAQNTEAAAFDARTTAFDGAVMLGDFRPISELGNAPITVEVNLDEKKAATASTEKMQHNIDELIALASNYFTLKMGDILVVGADQNEGQTLTIGQHLTASVAGQDSLKIRIK